MQDFIFKQLYDETFSVIGYIGDDAEAVIPPVHWGHPVTLIGDDVFRRHTEITSVRIPDTVRDIGGFVFDGCTGLRHIELPAGLENLWQYAFVRSSIEEIILPPGVRQIIPYTFKDCRNLHTFVCNEGLKKICAHAFEGCTQLRDFHCGNDTEISPQAFE